MHDLDAWERGALDAGPLCECQLAYCSDCYGNGCRSCRGMGEVRVPERRCECEDGDDES